MYWRSSKFGKFTIASTYSLLVEREWPSVSVKWKVVWDWNDLERIHYFLWLARHGKLLTNEERYRRHLAEDSLCPICNKTGEDVLHVLRDCPAAYYVWCCLVSKGMLKNFFTLRFDDWFLFNLKSKECFSEHIAWPMIFGVACWFLWQRRNKKVFDGNYVHMGNPSMAIVRYTELIYKSGFMARKFKVCKEEKLVRWSPPTPRWVKLNTDGAFKASSSLLAEL